MNLEGLRELYAWMRSERVLHARCGDLELTLGPEPPPLLVGDAPAPPPPDDERASLEALLWSSGADVDQFLRKGEQ